METSVKKWGKSLGIRIPAEFANQANISEGSKVNIVMKKKRIEIMALETDEKSLKDILNKISPENRHEEIDSGVAVGNEF